MASEGSLFPISWTTEDVYSQLLSFFVEVFYWHSLFGGI
jgi:hypothetical protein